MRDDFALEAGLAAHIEVVDVDLRRAGNQRDRRLGQCGACLGGGVRVLCLTGLRFCRPAARFVAGAGAGATSAAGEVTGAGMGGKVFVLSCAMRLPPASRPTSTSNSFSYF